MTEGELRHDVLEDEWRVISAHRQDRPNLPGDACPFCPGGLEARDPYHVRVFPNRWPPMTPGEPPLLDAAAGVAVARGAAEIILYTPDHRGSLGGLDDDDLALVVGTWQDRTAVLGARPEVAYVLCFENRGAEVGATIPHPHGQIYGFPFVPPRVRRILDARLCRVCADLAAADLLLGPDDLVRCWLPRASAWPYAFRLAPTRHAAGLDELSESESASFRRHLSEGLRAIDALWDTPMPYMLDLHQAPSDGAAWLNAHMWLEVACPLRAPLVRRFVAAGEIGSGTYQNPVRPEDAARALRAVWPA